MMHPVVMVLSLLLLLVVIAAAGRDEWLPRADYPERVYHVTCAGELGGGVALVAGGRVQRDGEAESIFNESFILTTSGTVVVSWNETGGEESRTHFQQFYKVMADTVVGTTLAVLAGGVEGPGQPAASNVSFTYDSASGEYNFSEMPPLPSPKAFGCMWAFSPSQVVIVGGIAADSLDPIGDVLVFDGIAWQEEPSMEMPGTRAAHACTRMPGAVEHQGVLLGGITDNGVFTATPDVWLFDINTGQWDVDALPDLPVVGADGGVAAYDADAIYFGGGILQFDGEPPVNLSVHIPFFRLQGPNYTEWVSFAGPRRAFDDAEGAFFGGCLLATTTGDDRRLFFVVGAFMGEFETTAVANNTELLPVPVEADDDTTTEPPASTTVPPPPPPKSGVQSDVVAIAVISVYLTAVFAVGLFILLWSVG